MFGIALLFVYVLSMCFWELVFVLIVHLFVSYAHVNLCHFFASSWCQGLAATSACALPGLFYLPFLVHLPGHLHSLFYLRSAFFAKLASSSGQ